MMHKKIFFSTLLLLLVAWLAPALQAQQPCQPPTLLTQAPGLNIFTQKQEVELGEAIAEHLQRNFRVLDDPEITDYLKRIGERIIKHLPPNDLKFQFFLVELPEANAFVLPGGRIYVSRKLVAFAQSEDEMAGVIAHETGHLIARQQAIEMTRLMREVLGVTSVTDRRDIFAQYNQLVENAARKPDALGKGERHEDKDQIVADQIGLFALAAAGYDPQAHVRLFDRLAETKGKTGNFFSDLFGATKPEAKRLREMMKGAAALPASCIEARQASASADFQKWQALVVNYTGAGKREALHGVLSKLTLEPPLRSEIKHLRFSPDGKYVLAQDDSGINVLSRQPFALLFHIRAIEANDAQFTPDSQTISFYNANLRVEMWSIAEQKLKTARELVIRKKCVQTLLSPDARTLACLDTELNLNLYDVETGAQIFQKKSFYTPNLFDLLVLSLRALLREDDLADEEVNWIKMGFSTDGKYFVAGQKSLSISMMATLVTENTVVAFNTQTRTPLSLKGATKKLIAGGFAFIGADRLVAYNQESPQKSALIALPSGETLEQTPLFEGQMNAVTKGSYLLVRPFQKYAVGVFDMAKKQIFKVNKLPAIDLYEDIFVAERTNGELVLYGVESNEARASLSLPRNPFGKLRSVTVSPDFQWLAASERRRGAVWDLHNGERIFHIRGFRGGYFAADGNFFADFPKMEGSERQIGRLNPLARQTFGGAEIKDEYHARQFGAFALLTMPAKKNAAWDKDVVLEMRLVQSFRTLWTKAFPQEAPEVWVNPRDESMVLIWALVAKHAQAEIKNDAALSQQLAAMKEKEGDYYLQILDARTGEVKGRMLLETGKGSFRIKSAAAVGDWLVITDSENRVLVYALATGAAKGKVFGSHATLSKASKLLCVENENGQLTLYDVTTTEKRDQFMFSSPVSLAAFSQDGKRLLVVTAEQTVYVLDVAALVH
ncbi:MAG: M48 family metalloprotease [Acidobacteria bacterium]|nr:M48 family metalloprotease [Acidobacteriota bacterium]